jgi:riboflavin kinase/FMN adenylyltransferase
MQLLHQIADLASLPGPLHLAAGFFDGVHLGHQEVLRSARQGAAADGGLAVVVTFDRHPADIIRPGTAPRLLTSTRHKALLMERLGAAAMLVIPFDEAMAATAADAFVGSLVRAARPLASISCGRDWTFGHARGGNRELLAVLGSRAGFAVHAVAPVLLDGEPVSSTRVRLAIEAGDFVGAARLLGRGYSILGEVIKGRQLGRRLGFPTANLVLEAEQLPPVGVYAVRAVLDGRLLDGVANLGLRPTIEDGCLTRHFEVHLFDFAGDIYGRPLDVRFVARLRDEVRFDSLDALKAQIADDTRRARALLGTA